MVLCCRICIKNIQNQEEQMNEIIKNIEAAQLKENPQVKRAVEDIKAMLKD